jgi:phosphopantothenoylcysteine decarboxylase/phosphopantothenate--cysteine ligase
LIGFALESGDGVQNAKKKLEQKNLDLVVLNSLDVKGAGFDVPTNKVKIIGRKGTLLETELKG